MDKRIETRMAWIDAAHHEILCEIGKLWDYAAHEADKTEHGEPYRIAEPMGARTLTAREKMLETRLKVLKDISAQPDLKKVIYMLSVKAKQACDRLYDFDEDSQSYQNCLAEISECTHMISVLI